MTSYHGFEVIGEDVPMRVHEAWNIDGNTKVLVGHPAGIDDVNNHERLLVGRKDEDVVDRMIDTLVSKLQTLPTMFENIGIFECHGRGWPARIPSRREQFG